MRRRLITATLVLLAVTGLAGWLLAADNSGTVPEGDYSPDTPAVWLLKGADAEAHRRNLVRVASPRDQHDDDDLQAIPDLPPDHPLKSAQPVCRFVAEIPTGTSAKFDCVIDGGEIVKVKYGRNPEIHAEVAATRLLGMLGYPADHVSIVPRLRCYGCPRFPFVTMQLLSATLATGLLSPHGYDGGYTDFEWVSVERKLPLPSIETETQKGWAWWELERSIAPRDELDALRLLAVFLAHWDNKADNQRLVCLDTPPADGSTCARPILMMQDVGATFGPTKVNLARWRDLPVWSDERRCRVTMRALPYHGGTFPDTAISEEGRALLAMRLRLLSEHDVRALFATARFPEFQTGTDNERDLEAWTAAFGHRVGQIVDAGPCPAR